MPPDGFLHMLLRSTVDKRLKDASYVYPKPENIVGSTKDYLKSYVDSFENALAGRNSRISQWC